MLGKLLFFFVLFILVFFLQCQKCLCGFFVFFLCFFSRATPRIAGELVFVPRAALVNLAAHNLDVYKEYESPIGTRFKPDDFGNFDNLLCAVSRASGVGNNWACGHTESTELIDEAVDAIGKKGESGDYLQDFQIPHSFGGTGLGTVEEKAIGKAIVQEINSYCFIKQLCCVSCHAGFVWFSRYMRFVLFEIIIIQKFK